jgi:predicted RecA/RadA family phage recombinase
VKRAITATVVLGAVLFAASMLGVAVAEAPAPAPVRTISVEGVADLPIGQADSAAAATAVYREAMSAAVADGQSKASFLAGKVAATPGAVQSVVEGGGYINCTGGDESNYAEYEGEQPDFGSAPQPGVASPAVASTPAKVLSGVAPRAKKKHPKRKQPVAKKAAAVSCTLTAQVALVYAIS